jgi:hypothetical protein
MADFLKAEKQYVKPGEAIAFKSSDDFIPIHRYPEGYEIGHYEIGMLAKTEGENVVDVYKRIFYA